jgi:hypothetical protein
MTERIELPDNAWAELRDPRTVPERLRRPITRAMFNIANGDALDLLTSSDDILSPNMIDVYSQLNDLVIVARVVAWSFDSPITVESVLELPGNVYEALQEITAEGIVDMIPNFAPTDDKDSPTNP